MFFGLVAWLSRCMPSARAPAVGDRSAGQSAGSTGLTLPGVSAACRIRPDTTDDSDADGLSDLCELFVAQAFAPEFVIATGGCDWDESVWPARAGGEYYFAVDRRGGDTLRIAYAPAYYRDCGWQGIKCWLPFVDCSGHAGDSEFIALDVHADRVSRKWRTVAIFLSAHCFDRHDSNCRWYRGTDLDAFGWAGGIRGGVPAIWISEGRHANYPAQARCDRGKFHLDTCDRNVTAFRYPVRHDRQNLGSPAHPAGSAGGCVDPRQAGWNSALTVAGATECFWLEDDRFRGWQGPGNDRGATPYARYLIGIAGFRP